MANEIERLVQSKYGRLPAAAFPAIRKASAPSPRRSGIPRRNSPASPPRPTWACPAATRPPLRVCAGRGGSGPGLRRGPRRIPGGPQGRPAGKAIGIDMTQAMVDLAKRNATKADSGRPLCNVEFHLATIDHLPLPDASVDVVISNCVINLAPDKPAVFREIARVLKPGGRLAVSDIALRRPLPADIARNVAAYTAASRGHPDRGVPPGPGRCRPGPRADPGQRRGFERLYQGRRQRLRVLGIGAGRGAGYIGLLLNAADGGADLLLRAERWTRQAQKSPATRLRTWPISCSATT